MNWLKRHLHWSLVLGWVIPIALWYLAIFITSQVASAQQQILDETVWLDIYYVFVMAYVVWLLVLVGWVLRQKGRSLGWLLLLFVPFGWLAPFMLDNRRNSVLFSTQTAGKNTLSALKKTPEINKKGNQMSFCAKCGNKLGEGDAFCRNCGSSRRNTPLTESPIMESHLAESAPSDVIPLSGEQVVLPDMLQTKQNWFRRGFIGLCILSGLLVATVGFLGYQWNNTASAKDNLQSSYNTLSAEKEGLITENISLYSQVNTLNSQNSQKSSQIINLTNQINQLNAKYPQKYFTSVTALKNWLNTAVNKVSWSLSGWDRSLALQKLALADGYIWNISYDDYTNTYINVVFVEPEYIYYVWHDGDYELRGYY